MKFNIFYTISVLLVISMLTASCSTPRSAKYRNHRHVGSSSYFSKSTRYKNKSRRNVLPISKNYRIKNKRTSGNY